MQIGAPTLVYCPHLKEGRRPGGNVPVKKRTQESCRGFNKKTGRAKKKDQGRGEKFGKQFGGEDKEEGPVSKKKGRGARAGGEEKLENEFLEGGENGECRGDSMLCQGKSGKSKPRGDEKIMEDCPHGRGMGITPRDKREKVQGQKKERKVMGEKTALNGGGGHSWQKTLRGGEGGGGVF